MGLIGVWSMPFIHEDWANFASQVALFSPSAPFGEFSFINTAVTADGLIDVPVARQNGAYGTVGVDVVAVNGTAIRGVDYFVSATTTLSWADSDAISKTVSVTIAKSLTQKTFSLRLQNATGSATINSSYDEIAVTIPATVGAAGMLEIFTGAFQDGRPVIWVSESWSGTLPVARTQGKSGAVGCSYHTEDGTAIAGVDYTAQSGILSWADGDVGYKAFPVTTLAVGSDNKYFYCVLDTPTGGATVGPWTDRCKVYIRDIVVSAGVLQFSAGGVNVPESAVATFTVRRLNGTNGAVSVTYGCTNGTALNGTHYTTTSGTLNWANGDAADKTFNVTILGVSQSSLYFTVDLSSPGGGATLGDIPTETVYIVDTGIPPANVITDTIDFWVSGNSEDLVDGSSAICGALDVHVINGSLLQGGVLGFRGGTGSFGGGTDLLSADEDFLPSMPTRFQMFEM